MAMVFIGERPVNDVDDPTTDEEMIINTMIDACRQTTLRSYLWNFATSRIAITRRAGAPLFGYSDAYNLPDDFIRFVRVNTLTGTWEFVRENSYRLAEDKTLMFNGQGAASLQIEYIKDVTDPSKWTGDFTKLMALNLAMDIAFAMTKEKAVVQMIDKEIDRFIPDALSITIQENPLRRVQRSKSIEARRGNVNTWWGTQSGQYVDT